MKSEEEFLKEHSYEAQNEFLNDLFTVTLHGALPGETQKKLFAAAAGMQSRCNKARVHIGKKLDELRDALASASSSEMNPIYARIDELKEVLECLS